MAGNAKDYEVTIEHSFIDGLLAAITYGIYTPTIITVTGIYQTGKYLFDYSLLTQYGKGYVWGSVFLTVIGVILLIVGFKMKSKSY